MSGVTFGANETAAAFASGGPGEGAGGVPCSQLLRSARALRAENRIRIRIRFFIWVKAVDFAIDDRGQPFVVTRSFRFVLIFGRLPAGIEHKHERR